jgi:hypothetical protein
LIVYKFTSFYAIDKKAQSFSVYVATTASSQQQQVGITKGEYGTLI